MKIKMHEDDPRFYSEGEEKFLKNCGSFSHIIHNINKCLRRKNFYSDSEEDADFVGFSSGLKLDFGFADKKRFLIHVWETNELPSYFLNFRKATKKYTVFGLSKQISDVWSSYGFQTETLDLGVDTSFWKPDKSINKNDKFTILSVTSCNFRSGINHLLSAFIKLNRKDVKLIIKNTDARATKLLHIINHVKEKHGLDIEYLCERQSLDQIKDLYNKVHLLVYIPINTSGGIPILEAGACDIPVLVSDYEPVNIYPHVEKVKCSPVSISKVKNFLISDFGLPYTFPEGILNEDAALVNWVDENDLSDKMNSIIDDYSSYRAIATQNIEKLKKDWSWDKTTDKLLNLLRSEA